MFAVNIKIELINIFSFIYDIDHSCFDSEWNTLLYQKIKLFVQKSICFRLSVILKIYQ